MELTIGLDRILRLRAGDRVSCSRGGCATPQGVDAPSAARVCDACRGNRQRLGRCSTPFGGRGVRLSQRRQQGSWPAPIAAGCPSDPGAVVAEMTLAGVVPTRLLVHELGERCATTKEGPGLLQARPCRLAAHRPTGLGLADGDVGRGEAGEDRGNGEVVRKQNTSPREAGRGRGPLRSNGKVRGIFAN